MKLPSKITSYNESVLSKIIPIISVIEAKDLTVRELYNETKQYFNDIEEYIDTIDCLFAIGKIILLKDRVIHYVD